MSGCVPNGCLVVIVIILFLIGNLKLSSMIGLQAWVIPGALVAIVIVLAIFGAAQQQEARLLTLIRRTLFAPTHGRRFFTWILRIRDTCWWVTLSGLLTVFCTAVLAMAFTPAGKQVAKKLNLADSVKVIIDNPNVLGAMFAFPLVRGRWPSAYLTNGKNAEPPRYQRCSKT